MKILILSSAFFSDNTLPLYKAMKEKGVDVSCLFVLTRPCSSLFESPSMHISPGLYMAKEFPDIARFKSFTDLTDVWVDNAPYVKPYSLGFLKSVLRISRFVRKGCFDYIHTDIFYIGWQLFFYSFRKKTALVVHEPILHARKENRLFELFRKLSFKLIPKLVVLNKTRAAEFCSIYNINPQRVLINKLGPLSCISIYKAEKKCTKDKVVLYWGRISAYKGIEFLCQAMIEVHKTIPDARVIIAGGGDFYFDISQYKELDYFTIINKFLSLEELADTVNISNVTVCPYINTSQSGGVLTSFAMGCPVIASDVETMREMIEDGKTGLLFKVKNSHALADAIVNYLSNPQMEEEMRRNISESFDKGKNSWAPIVDKYISFYQK